MRKIQQSIDIFASREDVWAAIISDKKYRLWTAVFQDGSYFEGGWQQGEGIKFLTEDEDGNRTGMISEIAVSEHLKYISIKHLGLMLCGVEDYTSDHAGKWALKYENYRLEKLDEKVTRFSVDIDIDEEYFELFEEQWTLALAKLKAVCEEKLAAFSSITVEAIVDAPLARVWEYWTLPEHVMKWNYASEDWHCPRAINNLSVGGRFVYTMAAMDGSISFDFTGTYTVLVVGERIINQLDDGRMMNVSFEALGPDQTLVVETFEAEDENSLDLQRGGWQAILDNFKHAVERNI
ncbi:MAG: SRPBCC domain-containing protein [Mobilitalea sp.]